MTVATFVQSPNYDAIINAIYDIAKNQAGLTYAAGNLYEIPTAAQLEGAGVPFLSVRQGNLEDWAVGGEPNGSDMRIPGAMEPVWEFEVFSIFPYSAANPNHAIASHFLVSQIVAFAANWDLENTCASQDIIPGIQNTGLTYLTIEGTLYRAAKVTLRVFEQLEIQYQA